MLEPAEVQAQPIPQPPEPPAGAGTEAAPASEERGGWWSRFLHTRGHQSDDASLPEEQPTEPPIASGPRQITLSEDELNQRIQRQAQSLHDREVARRNREAAENERRRLRDEDPVAYAEADRTREQTDAERLQTTAQLMTLLGHVGRQHDAVSIDPIINALPQRERERILALPAAGEGLPGRKLVVDEAVKALGKLEYERGFRDAQQKLRKDPAFRKSVMAEQRAQFDEPELYPGSGLPSDAGLGEDNVSTILRRQLMSR